MTTYFDFFHDSAGDRPGRLRHRLACLLLPLFMIALSGCATWYQRNLAFQQAVYSGELEKADKILDKESKQADGKNRILYYLNRGYVAFAQGQPEASNEAFETAERLADDQLRNMAAEAAALLTNPEAIPYRPEDFEVIMINFYKALNYLAMDDMEGALVEARKINIKLNALNDRYPDHKNRYQRDAFAHLLMGLIYDASGDVNNAFIAYRNAYETYESDYAKNYGIRAPEQLKEDLMRTAYACGFMDELQEYERAFGRRYTPSPASEGGQLVFFWLNGMGPVKAEWSVNFLKQQRGDGAIVFYNQELGLAFPFFFGGGYSERERNSIANLQVLRVAFPKYVERKPLFTGCAVEGSGGRYPLEMVEDINGIAFKTLNDRMLREFANSLLRVAAKKGVEYAAKQENEWLGLAVRLVNSVTEKADTRNWQTLPHSISYARVPLAAGVNRFTLRLSGGSGTATRQLTVEGGGRRTRFQAFQTMDCR